MPFRRSKGDIEYVRAVLNSQTGEQVQFDELRMLRFLPGQQVHALVHRQNALDIFRTDERNGFERNTHRPSTAALGGLHAGVVDKYTAHGARGERKKVAPILIIDPGFEKANVGLMHKRGSLERVARGFPAQLSAGQAAQLRVNDSKQLIFRARVPRFDSLKQSRYVDLRRVLGTIHILIFVLDYSTAPNSQDMVRGVISP